MYVTIRFTPQNLIVKWPFSLNLFANLINSLNYPPCKVNKHQTSQYKPLFRKEVTIKRDISVCGSGGNGEGRGFQIAV